MGQREVKQYSQEFRESSVELALTSGETLSKIAQELGVHISTLHGWIKRYSVKTKNACQPTALSEAQEELKRLRKENSRLRQERDILKKATAYFARETS